MRKLRQNPPFIGGARAAEIVDGDRRAREATVELLRRAGFRGMAFAEFKRDPRDGRFVFIEVNGRAVLFNSLLPPTGLDLVAMAWADFVLGANGPQAQPTRLARRLDHLQADLLCAVAAIAAPSTWASASWLAPYRKPKTLRGLVGVGTRGRFAAQTALAARDTLAARVGGSRRRLDRPERAIRRARNLPVRSRSLAPDPRAMTPSIAASAPSSGAARARTLARAAKRVRRRPSPA